MDSESPEVRAELRERLAYWRTELLDLSRRNRLLNFRHTKASTLEISEPGYVNLLDRLSRGLEFVPLPSQKDEEENEDEDEDEGVSDKRIQTAPVRGPRTGILTQRPYQEQLDRSLTRLRKQSHTTETETGIWVLYLGVGFLRWKGPNEQAHSEAPLLLVPAELDRTDQGRFRLCASNAAESLLNPALGIKLQEFGIDWTPVEGVALDEPERLLEAVRACVSAQSTWSVEEKVVLAPFTFHKETMYRDLEENEEAVLDHPVVQAISSEPGVRVDSETLEYELQPMERLDQDQAPETAPLVLDADAYQRRAVAAALEGRSFVLDGPPGTGKSQSIANIIAALIGAGRTVLFVSEKAAALEVVHSRLVDVGVDIAALSLHDGKTKGGAVAKSLEAALHAEVRPLPTNLAEERDKTRAIRERLSHHSEAVNDVDPRVGLSLNQAMGRVTLLTGRLPSDTELGMVTPDPALFTRRERERILDTALSMTHVWDLFTSPEDSPWNGIEQAEQAYEALTRALTTLNELDQHHGTLRRLTGGEHPSEPAITHRWVTLLEALGERDDVPAHWLVDADFDTAVVPRATEVVERLADLAWLRERTDFDWRTVKDLPTLAELNTDGIFGENGDMSAFTSLAEEQVERGLKLCATWNRSMTEAARVMDETVRRTGLPEPDDHASSLRVISVLAEISSGPHPLPHWLDETDPERVRDLLTLFESRRETLRESGARAQDLFHDGVLGRRDLPDLIHRLRVWRHAGRLVEERPQVPAHWLARRDFEVLVRRPVLAAWDRRHAHRTATEDLSRFTDLSWRELPDFDTTDTTTVVVGLETEASAERSHTDARFFGTWSTRLRQVITASDTVIRTLGCPRPEHPDTVDALLRASIGLGERVRPLPTWLDEETAQAAQAVLKDAEEAVTELVRAREAASDLFGPQVLEQAGLEELQGRLSSYGRFDRVLGSAFREDKRLLSGMTVSGAWDKRVPERLHEAIRWQRAHRRITDGMAGYRELLGAYWRGEETDFVSVRAALATAESLTELAPESGRSGLRRFLHQDQPLEPGVVAAARAALDELAPWEETARGFLPAEADLFAQPLERAADWLESAAERMSADAVLADTITAVTGSPVTTGRARDIRERALRVRSAYEEQRDHEEDDRQALGSYHDVIEVRTRQELEQDLDWAERVHRELVQVTEPVLGADCVDAIGIESLRELTRHPEPEEKAHGVLGRTCHRDRSLAAALTHDGLWTDGVLDRILDAQRWNEDHLSLWDQETVFAQAFGHHWRGEKTDPTTITAALERVGPCRSELDQGERRALAHFLEHGELTDLREDLDQARRTLADWPGGAQALPGGPGPALELSPAGVLSWLGQTRERWERIGGFLSRFRDATGRQAIVSDAEEDISFARYRAMAEVEREGAEKADRALLGPLYQVEEGLGETFQSALNWSRRVRRLVTDAAGTPDHGWPEEVVAAMRVRCDPVELARAVTDWEKEIEAFTALFDDLVRPVMAERLSGNLAEVERVLFALREDISSLDRWSTALASRRAMETHGLGPLLERYIVSQGDPDGLPDLVEHAILRAWVDGRLGEDERVRREPGPVRDEEVREFRRRDHRLHTWARQKILHQWAERRPSVGSYSPGIGTIRREAEKKRRHMPVRRLIEQATWETQLLTPCLMMSPLTVSMFLPPHIRFDVVIFDEASQVKPADAINCVYRGRSLIVAGDQKQLPPTGFFDRVAGGDEEWEEDQQETYESLLDMCKASGRMRDIPLRWHYRSRHEDLITFSNRKFYDSELITFPGARLKDEDTGVAYIGADGVYDRGGARNNRIEANRVAARVIHHFKTRPGKTLGVVAMSREQANAIEAEVDQMLERYPRFRHLAEGDRLGGFFVKNLETVQGDERDVIILSVGYGPTADGRIHKNFGPLNRADGHRRLNVAITRARQRVEVVCSFSADQLRVGPDDAEGLRRLCEYLRYAEHGPLSLEARPVADHDEDVETESPFEESVLTVLRDWGYEVQPQVGVAGYRIDLGVRHPELPGRFVLGVECDGAMYHSSKIARDRDRLRDGVLTGLGWRLHRIWGTDWYRDRARAEQRLREVLEEAVERERTKHGASKTRNETAQEERRHKGRKELLVTVPNERKRAQAVNVAAKGRPPWLRNYVMRRYQLPWEAYTYELRDVEARPHIADMFGQVIKDESPVEVGWLYRRVFDNWGAGERLGSTIRANFDATLEILVKKGLLRRDGDTIWWPESEVCVRRPAREEAFRKVAEVPPAERREALRLLVRDSGRILRKDLLRSMRETFEWKRSGKDITQAFETDLETLLIQGVLTEENDVIRLVE